MGILRHVGGLLKGEGHLCMAAHEGNLEKCRKLLALDRDVNEVDGHGNSPLYIAASQNHAHVVQWLLRSGADPNWEKDTKGRGGGTALHVAARKGHARICEILIEAGMLDEHQETALAEAVMALQFECADVLSHEEEAEEPDAEAAAKAAEEEAKEAAAEAERQKEKERKTAAREMMPFAEGTTWHGTVADIQRDDLIEQWREITAPGPGTEYTIVLAFLGQTEQSFESLEKGSAREKFLGSVPCDMLVETAYETGLVEEEYERLLERHIAEARALSKSDSRMTEKMLNLVVAQGQDALQRRLTELGRGDRERWWSPEERGTGEAMELPEPADESDEKNKEHEEQTEKDGNEQSLASWMLELEGDEAEGVGDMRLAYIAYRAAYMTHQCGESKEGIRKAAMDALHRWRAGTPTPTEAQEAEAINASLDLCAAREREEREDEVLDEEEVHERK